MTSSEKQRLWATCLGITVDSQTPADEVSAAINQSQSSKQWKSKVIREQKTLAKQMGIDVGKAANGRQAAGSGLCQRIKRRQRRMNGSRAVGQTKLTSSEYK